MPVTTVSGRWNHNIHYRPLILGAVPAEARDALAVGCGEGTLARQLRRIVPHVVTIDLDQPSIELAKNQSADSGIDYRQVELVGVGELPVAVPTGLVAVQDVRVDQPDALRLRLGQPPDQARCRDRVIRAVVGIVQPHLVVGAHGAEVALANAARVEVEVDAPRVDHRAAQ